MKDWKAFDDINYLDLQKKLALTYLKLDPVQTSVKFNLREKMTNQLTGAEIVFKALEEHGSSIYLVIQVVQSYLCTIKYQNKKK